MPSTEKETPERLAAVSSMRLALRVQLAAMGALEFGASKALFLEMCGDQYDLLASEVDFQHPDAQPDSNPAEMVTPISSKVTMCRDCVMFTPDGSGIGRGLCSRLAVRPNALDGCLKGALRNVARAEPGVKP